MVAIPIPQRVKLPLAQICAVGTGMLVAIAILFVPADLLEAIVLDSGIPAVFPAAAPPLGMTARMALAVTAGAGLGAAAWLAAFLILGGEGVVTLRRRAARPRVVPAGADVPVLRRADAHPDAPARAPLLATRDLGTPFLDVRADPPSEPPAPPPVERDLPRDLAMPLAAFDPAAIPDMPAEPVPVAAPLARLRPAIHAVGERFESFELPRPAPTLDPDAPRPITAPRTDATIHALLERLERGIGRRADADPAPHRLHPAAPDAPPVIETALEQLRRMAIR